MLQNGMRRPQPSACLGKPHSILKHDSHIFRPRLRSTHGADVVTTAAPPAMAAVNALEDLLGGGAPITAQPVAAAAAVTQAPADILDLLGGGVEVGGASAEADWSV